MLSVFAHTSLLIIEDSDETYVYVKAGFSNGQDASEMNLYVKSKFDDRIIESLKFPETSQLKIQIPNEPYYMMFDGGPSHKVAKNGPQPEAGFTVHPEAASKKIPGQGMPLWMIITVISAVLVIIILVAPKILKKS